ncbi:MAG: helix-turn-helix domain-containing protein [Coleofasciculaceae cyanobacterium SM2_1_6]|nr:helix-turn-helix domain-containing protein [Coleofasciculaceae cyanobacterium SM2_1_6]
MPRSVRLHPDHKETVRLALERNRFLTQGQLAVNLGIALSTVSNFFNCIAVSIATFEAICEALGLEPRLIINLDKSTEGTNGSFFTPNVYNEDTWVGREKLIGELGNRICNNYRLLLLVGISGIGKTALGERLVVEVSEWLENNWACYHQENFDNQQQSSDFASVAARWLEKWGELVSPEDRKDPQRLINLLMKRFSDRRYLIQIDSLENILQGNEETGWSDFQDEWWLSFFSSYLKLESCKSCLIITSQDLPGQIEAAGSRYKNFWYCQPLSGLDEVERVSLFEKIGLDVSPESTSRDYLERIGKAYEGHPLALRVIGGEIKDPPFGGNVLAYWNKYGHEVEEVEKDIAEAEKGLSAGAEDKWRLDRFTRILRRNVRSRLDSTFQRLKEGAKWSYILLCEGAVYRYAVPEDWWLGHFGGLGSR